MKRTIAMVLALVMALALLPISAVSSLAAFADKTIEITSKPSQTLYFTSENFDLTGLAAKLYYTEPDGYEVTKSIPGDIALTDLTIKIGSKAFDSSKAAISNYVTSTTGTTTVTLSYTVTRSDSTKVTCTGSYSIYVRSHKLTGAPTAKTPLTTTEYASGAKLSFAGLTLQADYLSYLGNTVSQDVALTACEFTLKNGGTESAKFKSTSQPTLTNNTSTYVTYELIAYFTDSGVTKSATVASVVVTPASGASAESGDKTVEVTSKPAKVLYLQNEQLDFTGLEMTAHYVDSDGAKKDVGPLTIASSGITLRIGSVNIPLTAAELAKFDLSKYVGTTGVTTITILYTTKNSAGTTIYCWGSLDIRVRAEKLTEIITASDMKTTIFYTGETLDLDGLALQLLYKTYLGNSKTKSAALSAFKFAFKADATDDEKFTLDTLPKMDTAGSYTLYGYYTDENDAVTVSNLIKNITVKDAATAVAVAPATLTIPIDGTTNKLGTAYGTALVATSTFGGGDETDPALVSWGSSDEKIVTVDSKGVLTPVSYGKATITVRTRGSKIEATCEVTVEKQKVYVTGISFNKTALALNVNDSDTLLVTLAPANTTDTTITWANSDNKVISLDEATGKVTALKAGTATITATVTSSEATPKTYTATCVITVTEIPVETIFVAPEAVTVFEGTSYTITGTVLPYNATNPNITWRSSDESIATVKDGVVTIKSIDWLNTSNGVSGKWTQTDIDAGKCTTSVKIYAYPADYATMDPKVEPAVCTITIKQATLVKQISLNKSACALSVSGTAQLSVTYVPTNATTRSVTWYSENTEVATVSSTGKITGVAPGQTIVWAIASDSANGAKAKCVVSVTNIATGSIGLNALEKSMYPGETLELKATVYPTNATNKNVVFTSSAPGVASVDANGLITANSIGKATITVTAEDGSAAAATCLITVTQKVAVTKITISPSSFALLVNDTTVLSATVLPDYASTSEVTWASSNPSAVSIDENGKVTGLVAGGTATITATSKDGSGASGSITIDVVSTFYGTGKVVNCLRRVNVREKASGSSTRLGFAYLNQTFKVIGKTGSWYKISFEGKTAYIWASYLRLLGDGEAGYTSAGKVTTTTTTTDTTTTTATKATITNCVYAVNVRSGPGTTYDKIGIAPLNNSYAYLGTFGDWYKVQFNTTTVGYIHSAYVKLG